MGVSLHTFGLPPDQLGPLATTAERSGFECLWLSEHLIAPVGAERPHPRHGTAANIVPASLQLLDPWIAISFMAAQTTRLRFGTSIYLAPLRHPILTARVIGSAQALSGGRVLAGLGVGWLEEEFEAVGADFADRGNRMEEILDILGQLWSGGPVKYRGSSYEFGPVDFGPLPQRVPTILGGASPPALRRAARRGDGWVLTGRASLEELEAMRDQIEGYRAEYGRLDRPFTYYVSLESPDREQVERYRTAGFANVIVNAYGHWRAIGADLDCAGRVEAVEALARRLGIDGSAAAPRQP